MKTRLVTAVLMATAVTACQRRAPNTSMSQLDSMRLAQFATLPDSIATPNNPHHRGEGEPRPYAVLRNATLA